MSPAGECPPKPSFLGLPPELRNHIYSLILTDRGVLRRRVRNATERHIFNLTRANPEREEVMRAFRVGSIPALPRNVSDPALLHVNRQLRREVGSIFYGMYELYLTTAVEELPVAVAHLSTAMDLTGRAMPFAGLRLTVDGLDWANLEALLPLLDFIRLAGFSSDFQLLIGRSEWASVPDMVARRALRFAARAARQGWDALRLRREVLLWARRERQVPLARLEMAAETIRRRFRLPFPRKWGFGVFDSHSRIMRRW